MPQAQKRVDGDFTTQCQMKAFCWWWRSLLCRTPVYTSWCWVCSFGLVCFFKSNYILCYISRFRSVTSQLNAATTKACAWFHAFPSAPWFLPAWSWAGPKLLWRLRGQSSNSPALSVGWQSPELTSSGLGQVLQVLDHCVKGGSITTSTYSIILPPTC